jgi:hypothetical protein
MSVRRTRRSGEPESAGMMQPSSPAHLIAAGLNTARLLPGRRMPGCSAGTWLCAGSTTESMWWSASRALTRRISPSTLRWPGIWSGSRPAHRLEKQPSPERRLLRPVSRDRESARPPGIRGQRCAGRRVRCERGGQPLSLAARARGTGSRHKLAAQAHGRPRGNLTAPVS